MIVIAAVPGIPGHAVFLLLIQLALLLMVARSGALLARLFGLPAVVGELAAGIVLGPTVFGHYAPGLFAAIFPQTVEQFHLLETVGVLGMVFLLLLTGLEQHRHNELVKMQSGSFGQVFEKMKSWVQGNF